MKISVIIAAFNEAERIGNVLSVATKHPLINEIIVVDDGSTDNTVEVIKQFKVRLIKNEKNRGKTFAVKQGLDMSRHDLIMLLDADLIGLTENSITSLVKPVLEGEVDWTLSLRENSYFNCKILQKITKVDWMSGERVVPKNLLLDPAIWLKLDAGYGLECLMNRSLLKKKATFKAVYLKGVDNPPKFEKQDFWVGVRKEFDMSSDISKVVSKYESILQLVKMSYLHRKYSKK